MAKVISPIFYKVFVYFLSQSSTLDLSATAPPSSPAYYCLIIISFLSLQSVSFQRYIFWQSTGLNKFQLIFSTCCNGYTWLVTFITYSSVVYILWRFFTDRKWSWTANTTRMVYPRPKSFTFVLKLKAFSKNVRKIICFVKRVTIAHVNYI